MKSPEGLEAHICVAAPNGPRYDPFMTPEERSGEGNGILLCREHASIIDIDKAPYPVELLKQWKQMAYKRAQELLILFLSLQTRQKPPILLGVNKKSRLIKLPCYNRDDLTTKLRKGMAILST